jgi:hypothetical protein
MVSPSQPELPQLSPSELRALVEVGDVVFICSTPLPFRKVAAATGCWSNHVGIVVQTDGPEPMVAESTFPFSRLTPLSQFVKRSARGRVAVRRPLQPLNPTQRAALLQAVQRRLGVLYDTGFHLHSPRQFCSRFVREVLAEATGVEVGDVETFAQLLSGQPGTNLAFWRAWYFGRIPWNRPTVTPASQLRSPLLETRFDGRVVG